MSFKRSFLENRQCIPFHSIPEFRSNGYKTVIGDLGKKWGKKQSITTYCFVILLETPQEGGRKPLQVVVDQWSNRSIRIYLRLWISWLYWRGRLWISWLADFTEEEQIYCFGEREWEEEYYYSTFTLFLFFEKYRKTSKSSPLTTLLRMLQTMEQQI